ncbi:MAG: GT-D fold domain-containing protein, partial [Tannerella sp.]|nr:GT-D fold domain-containing protein [Tannerella sp.]
MIERIKVFIWALLHFPQYNYLYEKTKRIRQAFKVWTSEETVQHIVNTGCSVSRYGDGELRIMYHYTQAGNVENYEEDTFFRYDEALAKRLIEIYQSELSNHLVCIP